MCAWIGNSESVAREHYLQVTPEHIAKAIASRPLTGVMPQVMPHGVASCGTESQVTIAADEEDGHNSVQRNKKRPHAKTCDRSLVEDRGLEPRPFYCRNTHVAGQGGAKSGAVDRENVPIDPDLAQMIDAWHSLPPDTRTAILAIVEAAHGR